MSFVMTSGGAVPYVHLVGTDNAATDATNINAAVTYLGNLNVPCELRLSGTFDCSSLTNDTLYITSKQISIIGVPHAILHVGDSTKPDCTVQYSDNTDDSSSSRPHTSPTGDLGPSSLSRHQFRIDTAADILTTGDIVSIYSGDAVTDFEGHQASLDYFYPGELCRVASVSKKTVYTSGDDADGVQLPAPRDVITWTGGNSGVVIADRSGNTEADGTIDIAVDSGSSAPANGNTLTITAKNWTGTVSGTPTDTVRIEKPLADAHGSSYHAIKYKRMTMMQSGIRIKNISCGYMALRFLLDSSVERCKIRKLGINTCYNLTVTDCDFDDWGEYSGTNENCVIGTQSSDVFVRGGTMRVSSVQAITTTGATYTGGSGGGDIGVCRNCVWEGLTIHHTEIAQASGSIGIDTHNQAFECAFRNLVIYVHSTALENSTVAISVRGRFHTVENCRVIGVGGNSTDTAFQVEFGHGHLFRNNYVDKCSTMFEVQRSRSCFRNSFVNNRCDYALRCGSVLYQKTHDKTVTTTYTGLLFQGNFCRTTGTPNAPARCFVAIGEAGTPTIADRAQKDGPIVFRDNTFIFGTGAVTKASTSANDPTSSLVYDISTDVTESSGLIQFINNWNGTSTWTFEGTDSANWDTNWSARNE